MVFSSNEISEKIVHLNSIIEELEPYFKERKPKDVYVGIRFPFGVIHKADEWRRFFPFINNMTLKTNIAYTLQVTDVIKWILRWFDLKGVAREMLIKIGIILFTSVQEALAYDFVNNYVQRPANKRYSKNLKKLLERSIITQHYYAHFEKCRCMRDDIHLHRLGLPEREKYTLDDYNYVGNCLNRMKDIFLNYYRRVIEKHI